MYRPKTVVSKQANDLHRPALPPSDTVNKSKEIKCWLLWRKKSQKVHKSWEGDTVGTVSKVPGGYVLSAKFGHQTIPIKLGSNLDVLLEGNILSNGSIELQIDRILDASEGKQTETSPQLEPVDPVRKITPAKPPRIGSSVTEDSQNAFKPFQSPLISTGPRPIKAIDAHNERSSIKKLKKANNEDLPSKSATVQPSKRILPFKSPVFIKDTTKDQAHIGKSTDATPFLQCLRPHQVEAVKFMKDSVLGRRHRYGNGCILADEMGLGKTLSTIALIHNLLAENHIKNALIVCPVTLIANWKAEFRKWGPLTANISIMTIDKNGLGNGSLKDPAMAFFNDPKFRSHQVLIVGYERVRNFSSALTNASLQFDLVICDEGHRLKTSGSLTAEAISNVSDDKRIILTGTPIQNDLMEFWSIANFVNPGVLDSEATFARRFAAPLHSLSLNEQARWDAVSSIRDCYESKDESNAAEEILQELTEICDEIMLRRTAEVISKYVSVPCHEFVIFCRPTQRQLAQYRMASGQALELWSSQGFDLKENSIQTISQLRKIAADEQGAKFHFLSCFLDVLSKTDEKVVIASGSTRVLDICQSILVSKRLQWLRLDGQTPQEKRQSCVRIFNKTDAGSSFAFLLSSRSGGMGLNLIGGSRLVLLDCDWNPAIDAQVMARIHRDGQTRPCYIYRFLTTGTIEEKIFQRQLTKIGLSNNVLSNAVRLSGMEKSDFTREVLRDLFTLTIPEKCNTLDVLDEEGSVKGYHEAKCYYSTNISEREDDTDPDSVLSETIKQCPVVSCVLQKS